MPGATKPGTAAPAPAPVTIALRAVDFGDLEVYGDPGEQNILVSNDNDKTGHQLTIVPPKDPDGQKLSADFQLETKGTDSEPCAEVLKTKTHCRLYVRFAPTTAGPKANKVEITVKGVKDDVTPDDRAPSFL